MKETMREEAAKRLGADVSEVSCVGPGKAGYLVYGVRVGRGWGEMVAVKLSRKEAAK